MNVEPQKEHQWLQRLVGEWEYESEASMGPGQPPMRSKGTESVRSLGGLWVVGEGQGEMPGCAPMETIITLGYDPVKKRFVGTFLASMMTHLWLYDGELDASAKVLTLDAERPSCIAEGKTAKYKDAFEILSDDHSVLTSRFLGEDGQWHQFMTAHYRRVK
jgi:hypothetical protein